MDITQSVMHFREVARFVWNQMYEAAGPDNMDWDRVDDFHGICTEIFKRMVCDALDVDTSGVFFRPTGFGPCDSIPEIRVSYVGEGNRPSVIPLRNHRIRAPGEYETLDPLPEMVDVPVMDGFVASFVSFFDWYDLSRRDFAYVMFSVLEFPAEPQLVGQYCIAEAVRASFTYHELAGPK